MFEFEVIFPFLGEGVVERRIEYRMWSHTQATAIQPDDTTTCSRGKKEGPLVYATSKANYNRYSKSNRERR